MNLTGAFLHFTLCLVFLFIPPSQAVCAGQLVATVPGADSAAVSAPHRHGQQALAGERHACPYREDGGARCARLRQAGRQGGHGSCRQRPPGCWLLAAGRGGQGLRPRAESLSLGFGRKQLPGNGVVMAGECVTEGWAVPPTLSSGAEGQSPLCPQDVADSSGGQRCPNKVRKPPDRRRAGGQRAGRLQGPRFPAVGRVQTDGPRRAPNPRVRATRCRGGPPAVETRELLRKDSGG